MRHVFAEAPVFLGCASTVSEHGSFRTVPNYDDGWVLIRDSERLRLLSNVCVHRGHMLLRGSGCRKEVTCPMHAWRYGLNGKLKAAPLYDRVPEVQLDEREVQDWNGLLFSAGADVGADLRMLAGRPSLNVRDYVLCHEEREEQLVNWKIPIEVLLENYHAPFIHPGFTRFADSRTWYECDGTIDTDRVMLQEMRPNASFHENSASEIFTAWQRAILDLNGGSPPEFCALVVLYHPSTIIEWWPYTFVATTYLPRAPGCTLMTREFYFDRRAIAENPLYPKLAMDAWYETQAADDRAHEALHQGRAIEYRRNPDAKCGYEEFQIPMEESVGLFYQTLLRAVPATS